MDDNKVLNGADILYQGEDDRYTNSEIRFNTDYGNLSIEKSFPSINLATGEDETLNVTIDYKENKPYILQIALPPMVRFRGLGFANPITKADFELYEKDPERFTRAAFGEFTNYEPLIAEEYGYRSVIKKIGENIVAEIYFLPSDGESEPVLKHRVIMPVTPKTDHLLPTLVGVQTATDYLAQPLDIDDQWRFIDQKQLMKSIGITIETNLDFDMKKFTHLSEARRKEIMNELARTEENRVSNEDETE